jgi:hypothetical protein
MTFVHAYLLGGLALISVPVLVHLVTREKPRHVRFPAFRFLVQKFHTNRRKLRLHQILLMLLRMALIAALCLALARPRLYSDRLPFFNDQQSVRVAMIFDTSASMDYRRGEPTRLEEARHRALELLTELPAGSKVAVFDSSQGSTTFENREEAARRIKELETVPANGPVSALLDRAFRLLTEEDPSAEPGREPPPGYLYIFSDRTRASWDVTGVRGLKIPEGVRIVYADVGIEKPTDLAVGRVEAQPMTVAPGRSTAVRVVVRATGAKASRKITCQLDNEDRVQEKVVEVGEDGLKTVVFEYRAAPLNAPPDSGGLRPGSHQVTVRLEGTDLLPFNNVGYATFVVRPGRKVLTLADRPSRSEPWLIALEVNGFTSVVKAADEAEEIDFKGYDVVCLYQVEAPTPALWNRLNDYVSAGGKLIVVPGGDEMRLKDYAVKGAAALMPAQLTVPVTAGSADGFVWSWRAGGASPIMAPFLRWRRERSDIDFLQRGREPRAYRYWGYKPNERATVLASMSDGKESTAALLERDVGQGKVVLFTTKLDLDEVKMPFDSLPRRWVTYWSNSFGLVLVDQVTRYLAGDSVTLDWNGVCGQMMTIPLGTDAAEQFLLRGPGLPQQGVKLQTPPGEKLLRVSRAVQPGNYSVASVFNERVVPLEGFSLNVRPGEDVLIPRQPKEELESVLGKDSVVTLEHDITLREAVSDRPQPLELLPVLMFALLLFLVLESLLSNRRRDTADAAAVAPEAAWTWRPVLNVVLWAALGVVAGAVVGVLREGFSYGPGLAASMTVTGLMGTGHGLLVLAGFGPRDGMILGGLLGSMAGVLYGWLLLGPMDVVGGVFAVFVGMILGGGVLVADGWFLGVRNVHAAEREG